MYVVKNVVIYILDLMVFLNFSFFMWKGLEWPPMGTAEGERETSCGSDIGDLMSVCLCVPLLQK